jgi:hypothetical protein
MHSRGFRWAAVLALGGAPWIVAAAPVPPPFWLWAHSLVAGAAVHSDPATVLRMGVMTVTLEKTSLAAVRQAVGAGTIGQMGDASESWRWLCYTARAAGLTQRVWLGVSEMGDGNVDGVDAMQVPAGTAATSRCPELPQRFLPLRLGDGLWIGSPASTVRKMLGPPRDIRSVWSYDYSGRDRDLSVDGTVMLKLKQGEVVALMERHTTSN